MKKIHNVSGSHISLLCVIRKIRHFKNKVLKITSLTFIWKLKFKMHPSFKSSFWNVLLKKHRLYINYGRINSWCVNKYSLINNGLTVIWILECYRTRYNSLKQLFIVFYIEVNFSLQSLILYYLSLRIVYFFIESLEIVQKTLQWSVHRTKWLLEFVNFAHHNLLESVCVGVVAK